MVHLLIRESVILSYSFSNVLELHLFQKRVGWVGSGIVLRPRVVVDVCVVCDLGFRADPKTFSAGSPMAEKYSCVRTHNSCVLLVPV